jgi:integrase
MPIKIRDESGIWWLDFRDPNGKRIRQSCGTTDKKQAQEYHDKLKAELWRVGKLNERPRYTWQEAVVKYVGENQNQRSMKTTKENLRYLDQFLSNKRLDEISKKLIESIKQQKIASGVSVATVNRMLTVLRAILNAAKHWDWIDSPPTIKLLSDNTQRIRWLTRNEATALLNELPEHLKAMVMFALSTGLRETNITGLQWSQVDMVRKCAWIHADQAKGKKAIAVPLNDDAVTVIKSQMGKHLTHVFTYKDRAMHRANNAAWRKALKRAGINDFRFHDLRHTWASWHVQNGTPLHVLKELGGWADMSMVLRYAHLSSEHLQHYANNASLVTNWSQRVNVTQSKAA